LEEDVCRLRIAEIQRVKQLEKENRQQKQLDGDQALVIRILQEQINKKEGMDRGTAGNGYSISVEESFGRTSLSRKYFRNAKYT
jgi:hypothetical protein